MGTLICIVLRRFSGVTQSSIHHIHKWWTRGKKLVPNHESRALEDEQPVFRIRFHCEVWANMFAAFLQPSP